MIKIQDDVRYNDIYGCYVIEVNGQVYEADTEKEAWEIFTEALRARREHLLRNPENKEIEYDS